MANPVKSWKCLICRGFTRSTWLTTFVFKSSCYTKLSANKRSRMSISVYMLGIIKFYSCKGDINRHVEFCYPRWFVTYIYQCTQQKCQTNPLKGKCWTSCVPIIYSRWHNLFCTVKTFSLPFKVQCANQMTCYSWCSCVQTRNLRYKIVSIVFSSPYNGFFLQHLNILYLYYLYFVSLCVHMQAPGQESVFNWVPIRIVSMYAIVYG